jgi:hypothetical protein
VVARRELHWDKGYIGQWSGVNVRVEVIGYQNDTSGREANVGAAPRAESDDIKRRTTIMNHQPKTVAL